MTESKGPFDAYISALRESDIREKTEHTDRGAIKALLGRFAAPGIRVVHEAKGVRGTGTPDFKVRQNGQILGYIEAKPLGTDLNKVLKSEQIKRYRTLSKNILLTNYLDWVWINGENIQQESLCGARELKSGRSFLDQQQVERLQRLLEGFVSFPPQKVSSASELASALASRGRLLRDFLGDELARQEAQEQGERLYGLYAAFRQQVSESITLPEFSDAFAQTLSYGLFLSKLNANGTSLNLKNADQYIPKSFKLIQELMSFVEILDSDPYKDIGWVIDEILSIINGLDVISVKEDLSFRNRKRTNRSLKARDEDEWRLFSRDPFTYFYEDYLSQYDADLRKSRGVYYTPPPVVNFIIRAIDDVLKDQFELTNGLADHERVTILEFACGTGTFLVEAIERIIDNLGTSSSARTELIIKEHVLKNIFAFEFLIAPYTIAHLKLSQYLDDRQIKIGGNKRFNIFLTNTLEPLEPQHNFFLPALSEETKRAAAVKKRPILVITGNPPYSGHSKNKGPWITEAIKEYKFTHEPDKNGALVRLPLGEKNPKWLQDDYVKFIRFAQMKMESVDQGVVGIITNHSYLSNPTFRGMRQSLMRTFDQVWVLDLHGSSKPKEYPPDGGIDENVFDIMKGVAISLFVKKRGVEKGVWHAELWGRRSDKYKAVAEGKKSAMAWKKLEPVKPFYLFTPQNRAAWAEYERGTKITDIFPINVLGFQTHRDHFAIGFTRKEIEQRVLDLRDDRARIQSLRDKYGLKDNRDWQLASACKKLKSDKSWRGKIIDCNYRPFDKRPCLFGYEVMDYPRRELIEHVAGRENISLVAPRQIGTAKWQHAFVADAPPNDCLVSDRTREANQVFPLFLFAPVDGKEISKSDLFQHNIFATHDRIENIAPNFRSSLDARYNHHFAAEQILGFIYAVLNAPGYRSSYLEFLRIDFPRIPFPNKRTDFEVLAQLGWDMIQVHLLRENPSLGLGTYCGQGDHEVDRHSYLDAEQAIYINATQYFAPVPSAVWNLELGGYKPLEKYLKSRKGRTLELHEIDNITSVANALAFTIGQTERIDEAYKAAFD